MSVFTGTGSKVATITDESFGGMGILVDSDEEFHEGQQIGLEYGGVSLRAEVRWTRQADNGQQAIGVEWLDERRQEKNNRRGLSRFVKPLNTKEDQRRGPTDGRRATDSRKGTDANRTARLVSIAGLPVVCGLVEERSDGQVTVQLPGGCQREVRLDDLQCSSMLERWAQLDSLDRELSILVGVYALGNPQTKEEAIKAVLDYEFAECVA